MAGNRQGGITTANKLREKNPDHYREIGHKGGTAPRKGPRGFAAMTPEQRSEAGKRGGKVSSGPPKGNKNWQKRKTRNGRGSDEPGE